MLMRQEEVFFQSRQESAQWLWLELIGFDNQLPDFGVSGFLERCQFQPDGVSLLLYSAGFVMRHMDLDQAYALQPYEQSYAGHPYSLERPRQNWTNWQLRDLIAVLHTHQIKVFLSFFNLYTSVGDDQAIVVDSYFQALPYLRETSREGMAQSSIHMLKRMADGSFFEDHLQQQTIKVLKDYAFDGVQIADGISSTRLALQDGDYSDDLVDQFITYSQTTLPDDILLCCDADPLMLRRRADWIWQYRKAEWIAFHVQRWTRFFEKFVRRLHASDKQAFFNSAWTRDPFEAIYRYGIDYRCIARTGIDGCIVEDVSAVLPILSSRDNHYQMSEEQRNKTHDAFLTALMLNRAAMPRLQLLNLASVHDTMEQWGVLEHMPTAMTRNVISNLNTFIWTGQRWTPVTQGPLFCLADALEASDWQFIRNNWNVGYTPEVLAVSGLTLVWSDSCLDQEINAFLESRRTPTHKIVAELLYARAPVNAITRIEHLDHLTGPVLVSNYDLMSPSDQEKIAAYQGGDLYFIGQMDQADLPNRSAKKTLAVEKNTFGDMVLFATPVTLAQETVILENKEPYDVNPRTIREPLQALWTHPLHFQPISNAFYQTCADLIIRRTGSPRIDIKSSPDRSQKRSACQMIAVKTAEKTWKIAVGNEDYFYHHPVVDMHLPIQQITCLTKYRGYKVECSGSTFSARIPGRGMEVFELRL